METAVEITLGASVDQQPSLELVIGELGEAPTATEIYFEDGRLITRQRTGQGPMVQPLNDRTGARTIAQLQPPGVPGQDRVRVWFQVDGDRRLRITVSDMLTGETLLNNQVVAQLT
jgi:hypothetical protein